MIEATLGVFTEELFKGIQILVIGVSVVFFVLGILSISIYLVGRITLYLESKVIKEKREKKVEKEAEEEEVAAAIAAAIAAYKMLKIRTREQPKRHLERSMWKIAAKLEAQNPNRDVSRANIYEILVEEGVRL